jgi:hypothetical protein
MSNQSSTHMRAVAFGNRLSSRVYNLISNPAVDIALAVQQLSKDTELSTSHPENPPSKI